MPAVLYSELQSLERKQFRPKLNLDRSHLGRRIVFSSLLQLPLHDFFFVKNKIKAFLKR